MVVFGQLFGLVVLMMRDWMHAWMGLPRRTQEIIAVLSIMMTHVLGCTLVRPHCDQGGTKLSTTGTGCAFSQQESVRVHDETWAGGNESLRLTISQAKEIFMCVWTRHSYRATNWCAVLATAYQVVEGYRTPDEALVCSGGCAYCREPEPLLEREFACWMALRR